MTAWTPEREADIRAIAERMEGESGHLLRATIAALDAERARREAAERQRDEARGVLDWTDAPRAALAVLREAVARTNETMESLRIDDLDANEAVHTLRWVRELRAALSAAAPISGRYRASAIAPVVKAVGDLLAEHGCDCDCDHGYDEHDDDCERCLACRIDAVLADAAEKGEVR